MIIMDWARKLTDLIMPLEPTEEEELEERKHEAKASESKVQQAPAVKEVKRAAAGGGVAYAATMNTSENGTMSVGGKRYSAYENPAPESTNDSPGLKIVKSPEFSVKIYHSINGSQVCAVADDILGRKAAVVNYEELEDAEQRRICDFINGVCYASDGSVRMISDRIFLYVPAGINSEDIAMAAASVYANGSR